LSKKRICFVCMGNIIRSPLAEHLFRSLARQGGVEEKYEACSAGTGDWHVGEPPDARMRQVAAKRGLQYSGRARQFQPQDLERHDLVLAMDAENAAILRRMARTERQRAKIRLLRAFDPLGGPNAPVPDPYYAKGEDFDEVYDIVERSVRGLLEDLERDDGAGKDGNTGA
jgi:protein-tyrosine phosphatase